jgi:hypothetical protein
VAATAASKIAPLSAPTAEKSIVDGPVAELTRGEEEEEEEAGWVARDVLGCGTRLALAWLVVRDLLGAASGEDAVVEAAGKSQSLNNSSPSRDSTCWVVKKSSSPPARSLRRVLKCSSMSMAMNNWQPAPTL